jgi:hypothetical protein
VAPDGKRNRAGSPGRYRRREIELAEGGKLILHTDGSIGQVDGGGETVATWSPSDAEWPRHAIRFGLVPQPATETPPDTRMRVPRPPGS